MICQTDIMAQGGSALGRYQGKIIFIEGALPGEKVQIEIIKAKKDFAQARVVKVLEPSPYRIDATCPLYGVCGGCNMQHANIAGQRKFKKEVAADAFKRMGKIDLPASLTISGGEPWEYRSRARFHQSQQQKWGFLRAHSRQVVPVAHCPLLTPGLQKNWPQQVAKQKARQMQIWEGTAGISAWDTHPRTKAPAAQTQILHKTFSADASVFFQSNLPMTEVLLERVLHHIPSSGGRAIDLFSGVGVFAAFLEEHFEQVQAVERHLGCMEHARRNLRPSTEFVNAPAETWLTSKSGRHADLLVVDPPRTGLPANLRQSLVAARPRNMIYVSCDPVTLARDAGELVRAGWELQAVEAFDFYPQSHHLEMLAVFKNAD